MKAQNFVFKDVSEKNLNISRVAGVSVVLTRKEKEVHSSEMNKMNLIERCLQLLENGLSSSGGIESGSRSRSVTAKGSRN